MPASKRQAVELLNHAFMKKKQFYEAPEAETIRIRPSGVLMNSNEGTETPTDGGDENFG